MQSDLGRIIILLRHHSGNDFSFYKTNTLVRRIERRVSLHQLAGLSNYYRFLRDNPQETDMLFKELLIGVTNFFRDPPVWEMLRQDIIPAMLQDHPAGRPVRAWVPACSSGEEAYSLAIIFREVLDSSHSGRRTDVQIYATDLDLDAVEKARKGIYPLNIAADVSPDRLARYFRKEDSYYRIGKEIRDMVVFATQNVISDPPFTRLDFLSCRNLLIYFRPQIQTKLLSLFHYSLNRNGLLLLGKAETVGSLSDQFTPVNSRERLFRRTGDVRSFFGQTLPSIKFREPSLHTEPFPEGQEESLSRLVDRVIQQNYAPAAVLVDEGGEILYFSGRTGKYLEPAAGKVNANIYAMARQGLRDALAGVIAKARQLSEPVVLPSVSIEDGTHTVTVTAQALGGALQGRIILIFQDVIPIPSRRRSRKTVPAEVNAALEQELRQTREALQDTHEEMQTSLEELRSSYEELQSSNEELTTSKEEMQSLNEELQTVNAELQSKVDALTSVQNDMINLLNSTEIATIFLDNYMHIRRFTSDATRLFKLIPVDIGRPLSDIVNDLDYPSMIDDALSVLRTLIFQEKQICTKNGHWFRVRIMPYRTQDNVIDGVVMTFVDISEIRKLKDELGK